MIIFMAACTSASGRSTAQRTAESEVRLAERERFAAMLKQDAPALETLLDADLTYVHTGGELESKAQFVELIRSKKLIYESIEPSDVLVRVHDGLALVTGRSRMRVRSATGTSSFGIRFTEVYVRRGGRWLLTAWEATRLAE
ncbi:MAG TPA: nuclear transport factor 2 family protein [Gemmatimonadaceae bacterium]|nr:nuclear transport factor 2 family protein [Gemmatimonadaceae bacterium]